MRKKITALGLILFIVGLAVLVFPTQETSIRTVDVFTWNVENTTPILAPNETTYAMSSMDRGDWLQLDVSSTDVIQLDISALKDQQRMTPPLFSQQGTQFSQKITISLTGSYVVDIRNLSPSTITLSGKGFVRQRPETVAQASNSYAFPGFLIMLGGVAILFYGIFKKPRVVLKPKGVQKRRS